jgi:hypothetical protein
MNTMKNEKQIDLIEKAMKNAYLEGKTPAEIPPVWQSAVMASIQREVTAEDKAVKRTEATLLYLSWIAAGIAAILVLVFGMFFNDLNDGSVEDDLQNLYVDNSMTDMLTINSQ